MSDLVAVNPVLVVPCGQSLWGCPNPGTTLAEYIRTDGGWGLYQAWEPGISWIQLARQPRLSTSIVPQANSAETTVLACMGGTTDLTLGQTAAQLYANLTTIKNAAVAAGYSRTIALTTTPAAGITAGAKEAERLAYNALLLANAAGFDDVVDVTDDGGGPETGVLADKADPIYYEPDQTHWWQAGTDVAWAKLEPAVLAD